MSLEPPQWAGAKRYYLAIEVPGPEPRLVLVDLDEPGWATTHADLMRAPGIWHLVRKTDSNIPFSMRVEDGDQPYCILRHIGIVRLNDTLETEAYGIGKKRPDGQIVALWVLPNDQVCAGDDVEFLARRLLNTMR